jgi:hypothetical protein
MRNFVLILVIFTLSGGCLERLEIPAISTTRSLVVDGMITDQQGPYIVKLFLSAPINVDLDNPAPVAGASVSIIDDTGSSETLRERIPGTYETSTLQTSVGKTYQLRIVTADGKEYESIPATLIPAGTIDDVLFEFRENVINPTRPDRPQDAFSITVNSSSAPGYSTLMRWRWTAIYHVKTFPELRTKNVIRNGEPVKVPDPLPCSGYVANDADELVPVKPCECCDCYVTRYSNDVVISENRFSDNGKFIDVQIDQLPADKWYFYDRYYIEAEQLSIQEDVYEFWKLAKTQQQGNGDIFQPNVVKVKGNIRCTTDPTEEVLGVFSVSGIAKKSIFIHRNDIPRQVPRIDTLRSDCRTSFFNSSPEKPPFW